MNRDTAAAIWYRRVDPSCFTAETPADAQASLHTAAPIPSHWLPIEDERARRFIGTIAERLQLGRLAG